MRKIVFIWFLLLMPLVLLAPFERNIYIIPGEVIDPYERIWDAVCMQESSGNPFAYNKVENAVGIAQIRQVRIDDYVQKTGKNYTLVDCYDKTVSKEIFMFYAREMGFRNEDLIIRRWNGSGPMTYKYLQKVKSHLRAF